MFDMVFGSAHHPNKHPHKKEQEDDEGQNRIDLYVVDGS